MVTVSNEQDSVGMSEDWESVHMSAAAENSRSVISHNAGNFEPKVFHSQSDVVVVLPPGGISSDETKVDISVSSQQQDQAAVSMGSFSFVDPPSRNRAHCDDLSSLGSTSTVVIPPLQVNSTMAALLSGANSTAGSVPSNSNSMAMSFEILSLTSNEIVKRCRLCQFHNPLDNVICGACGNAMIANPSFDLDSQVALALQRKEEEEAERLNNVVAFALSDDNLSHTFFQQSQKLADSILHNLAALKKAHGCSIRLLSVKDLQLLSCAFLEKCETLTSPKISLAYHTTSSSNETWDSIRKNGFVLKNQKLCVSRNLDAAFRVHGERINQHTLPWYLRLAPIQEHELEDALSEEQEASRVCGWIVATIEYDKDPKSRSFEVKISSGSATCTVTSPDQMLPLVCFDARLRKHDVIRQMMNRLSCVFLETKQSMIQHQEESTPMDLPRAQAARRYQESVYDDYSSDDESGNEYKESCTFENYSPGDESMRGLLETIEDGQPRRIKLGSVDKAKRKSVLLDLQGAPIPANKLTEYDVYINNAVLSRDAHSNVAFLKSVEKVHQTKPASTDEEREELALHLVNQWFELRGGRFFHKCSDKFRTWTEIEQPDLIKIVVKSLVIMSQTSAIPQQQLSRGWDVE